MGDVLPPDPAPALELLARRATEHGDAPALTTPGPGGDWRSAGAADLYAMAGATATRAAAAGLGPGGYALITLPNGELLYRAVLAAWWLGAVPLIASPHTTPAEREVLFSGLPVGPHQVTALPPEIVDADPSEEYPPRAAEPTPGWYLPSGGTTGLPKFVPVLHPPAFHLDTMRLIMSASGWRPGAVQLSTGPLHHAGPFLAAFAGLTGGAHVVTVDRFIPSRIASVLTRYPPTWSMLTPHQMALLDASEELSAAFGARLEGLLHSAAPCPPDLKRRWLERLRPERVHELYGCTQMVGAALCDGVEWLARPGTVGRPGNIATEVLILGPDGATLPVGEVGEVFMYTGAAQGHPAERVAHLRGTGTGHYSVGDLGYLDDDGYLYLTDRIDDVFTVGGANVSAREVELVLAGHPAVREVVVGRQDDELLGSVVRATVVPTDPARPPDAAQLTEHCRTRLARYKVPVHIDVVAELARSHAGKVERFRY
jgi:bile acid-coenzyme A ligase